MNNPLYWLVSLLAPDRCISCASEGYLLCAGCRSSLPYRPSGCFYCGQPNLQCATCQDCGKEQSLAMVAARTNYTNPLARSLLWRLKSDRARSAAVDVADSVLAVLPTLPPDTLVVPVPTANSRVRARGYDQAVLISRRLSKSLDLPCRQILRRLGASEQKSFTKAERLQAASQNFVIAKASPVTGRSILLVDDVVTTGASLEAAARVLRLAGARQVMAAVFAAA